MEHYLYPFKKLPHYETVRFQIGAVFTLDKKDAITTSEAMQAPMIFFHNFMGERFLTS
jgi:hypothetical protein